MVVSIVLDALIVLIAVIGIVIGLKRGFIKMFILRFRKLTAAILALLLAKPLGKILADKLLAGKITDFIMSAAKLENTTAGSPEELLETVPAFLRMIAGWFHYDLQAIAETAYANGEGMQKAIVSDLSYPIASFISVLLVWIVLFFAFRLLIRLLVNLTEDVFELPVLKQINAVCGAAVGLLLNAAIIWLACKLIGWLVTTDFVMNLSFMQGFSMEQTHIAKYVFHFNPLAFILSVKPE